MKLKTSVKATGLKPELLIALMVADTIYKDNGKDLVITSLVDSKHSRHSRHYLGMAADLRTRYFDAETLDKVVKKLKQALGKDFLVLKEKTHIHLSYKPQR